MLFIYNESDVDAGIVFTTCLLSTRRKYVFPGVDRWKFTNKVHNVEILQSKVKILATKLCTSKE